MGVVRIGKAAELLGVSVQTLRKWEDSAELVPDRRSEGGVRYYDMGKILGLGSEDMPIIGYARVSSHAKKMISFVSRNCSKPSVSQRLAS
jgi:predicted site-specific integrase-resolvase